MKRDKCFTSNGRLPAEKEKEPRREFIGHPYMEKSRLGGGALLIITIVGFIHQNDEVRLRKPFPQR
jgi:hypothetical protein